jgi:5-methylcytosine-specific restriction endonuclease McrA
MAGMDGLHWVPPSPSGWGGNRDIWRSTVIFSRYHKAHGHPPLKAAVRAAVLDRDSHECRYCRSTDRVGVDHVIPVCRDGTDDLSNLAACCNTCNRSKSDKPLDYWLSQQHPGMVWRDV